MATVNAVVYEHHKKADGTYNVKIKIFHQKKRAHIDTAHHVSSRQLNKDLQIKDKFILKILEETLEGYRRAISDLGPRLDFFTAEQLRDHLENKDKPIDFIAFQVSYPFWISTGARVYGNYHRTGYGRGYTIYPHDRAKAGRLLRLPFTAI